MPRSARPAGFAALALAALAVAGCDPYVQGNGVYVEENRTPSETFTGLQIQDGFEATVTSGAASQRVVVSGDANVVKDYVKTEVITDAGSGPVLHVRIEMPGGTVEPNLPLRVVVDLAELRYVNATGSSRLTASGVATQQLYVEARDDSDAEIRGSGGERIQVVASSSSRVFSAAYPVSGGALVDLSSAAHAQLHSDGPVAGSVGSDAVLENLGTGICTGVSVPAGETATIECPGP
jgi:hypothetical protein